MPDVLKAFLSMLSDEDKEAVADWLDSSDNEEVVDDMTLIVA